MKQTYFQSRSQQNVLPPCGPENAKVDLNVTKHDPTICRIFLYDNQVLFHPADNPAVVKALTIYENSLEANADTKWVRKTVRRKRELFTTFERNNKTIGITYQGFVDTIIQALVESGCAFDLEDKRSAISAFNTALKPDFSLMKGFRFSQEKLLTTFLSADRSGLLGAPTRYGKTTLMINTIRAYPNANIVVIAPGVDLVRQLYKDITGERGIKDREVKLICSGSKTKYMSFETNGVTICSADSLDKVDGGTPDIVLADEPHALVTQTRLPLIDKFTKARRYGFGATLKGRYDGRDKLITGVFGPVITQRTYKEAVEEGAICPISVIFVRVPVTPIYSYDRDGCYNECLFKSSKMANLTSILCNEIIPEDWQTLIFIKHEEQADLYMNIIGTDTTVAMAKRMSSKERDVITEKMRTNQIKRCLCTKIYVQGVTFSDVRVLINAEAGGNNTSAIQKPGRLAEIRPGKKCGIVFDFLFDDSRIVNSYNGNRASGAGAMVADSNARKKAYEEMGYDVHIVDTVCEAKELFDSLK